MEANNPYDENSQYWEKKEEELSQKQVVSFNIL